MPGWNNPFMFNDDESGSLEVQCRYPHTVRRHIYPRWWPNKNTAVKERIVAHLTQPGTGVKLLWQLTTIREQYNSNVGPWEAGFYVVLDGIDVDEFRDQLEVIRMLGSFL